MLILFFLAGLLLAPAVRGQERHPNVVVILVDDLGWTDLGCMGSEFYLTPNIDRLAGEGLAFEQAYAAAAVCSPSRAALLTGRSPARLGLTDWIRARFQGGAMPEDGKNPSGYVHPQGKPLELPRNPLWMELEEDTLAEELGAAGYRSCFVGKWHLGMDPYYPQHQGFDENHGGCDYGQPPGYFDPYVRGACEGIPGLPARRKGEYLTDREVDECLDFLGRARQGPFLLYWAPYAVHMPLQAKADLVAKYRERPATHQNNPVYAAMIDSVDQGVGRILAALEEYGLTRETLVVFTSDNGGLLGPTDNRPLREGKGYPFEGGLRVPLILRWPGHVRVGRSERPTIAMDLLPTLLEACGVKRRGRRPLDGLSLWPHCLAESTAEPPIRTLVWHFPHYRSQAIGPFSVLRRGDEKLILWWEDEKVELYDLARDIGEAHDLAAQRPSRAAALKAELLAELEALGARLPRRR